MFLLDQLTTKFFRTKDLMGESRQQLEYSHSSITTSMRTVLKLQYIVEKVFIVHKTLCIF